MTTYTAIANTEIDAESPITVDLMTKLRDNLLAIQEGDATAPKLNGSQAIDKTITSNGRQGIAAAATWTPAAGLYNFAGSSSGVFLQVYAASAWRGSASGAGGAVLCDGSNQRFYSNTSTLYAEWQKMDG